MTIRYTDRVDDLSAEQLAGFFVDWGWPNPPSPETHLQILRNSYRVWLALDKETGLAVGFINAISDGILTAYIPLLEVRHEYQGQGIGLQLTQRMLNSLSHLYMVDLICEADVQPFYERAGMRRAEGMIQRNYANQSGRGVRS